MITRIWAWINARLRIVATDEESARYSRVDDEIREAEYRLRVDPYQPDWMARDDIDGGHSDR